MNPTLFNQRPWRISLAGALLVGLSMLSACGGGGGSDSVGTSADNGVGPGGTGAFSSGAIRGLGSIVVNGVRYDDSTASITDDLGNRSDSSSLKLGVLVDVQGDAVATPATGLPTSRATSVVFRSEIKGPISALNASAGTLTVLGQSVVVNATTVLDLNLPNGLASVGIGSLVEVYGFVDAAGVYQATRIEREDSTSEYKVRGLVSALDTTARTFRIGTAVIDYGSLASSVTLANGQIARVELATTPNPQGLWVATRINGSSALPSAASSAASVEIEGVIASLSSSRSFVINGITVDAATASSAPANLAVGNRVEVKGRLQNGVLIATRVEREDSSSSGNRFEIKGNITMLDSTARTFEIRGVLISYANARFDSGTTANLAAGVRVEVEGRLSANGTVLDASELEFKGLDDVTTSGGSASGYEVKGSISALSTEARTFVVRGVTVNYASARFEDGSAASLALGSTVDVEGTVIAGVLQARKVEFGSSSNDSFEIDGSISALNTAARTFTVANVVVAYGSARFQDGTVNDLRVGARVEVKGSAPVNGLVTASEVDFDD